MSEQYSIDFVMPWVDGADAEWRRLRNSYVKDKAVIKEAQYRDWDILKYWFRSVEKYAPWVNKIHFVTCGQIPSWLKTDHPKLNCVNHSDYIPEEYLPTFSANTIELNFHRIPDLAEHFVYFNDDMFLNAPVAPSDFFVNGMPCESPILSMLVAAVTNEPFVHYLCNDMAVINQHFDKREVLKSARFKWFNPKYGKFLLKNLYCIPGKKFSAFHNFHIASSMRKSTFEEVWELEPDILRKTCENRFRGLNDVNQYVMSYYNICKGEFVPRRADTGKFYVIGINDADIQEDVLTGKHKMICINDNTGEIDVEKEKERLIQVFDTAFPEKSAFEK